MLEDCEESLAYIYTKLGETEALSGQDVEIEPFQKSYQVLCFHISFSFRFGDKAYREDDTKAARMNSAIK